jgi:hypothetical protein
MPQPGNGPHLYIRIENGHDQSISQVSARDEKGEEQRTGAGRFAPEAGCMHARLYDDAEKAEFSDA